MTRTLGRHGHSGSRKADSSGVLCALLLVIGGLVSAPLPAAADAVLTAETGAGTGSVMLEPPSRFVDTRPGSSAIVPGIAALAPNEVRTLDLETRMPSSLPDNTLGVFGNLTVVNPPSGGYLAVWQAGKPRPRTSSVNFVRGKTVSNFVVVPMAKGDFRLTIYNASGGTIHFILDLDSILSSGASNNSADFVPGSIRPVAPQRLLDTRTTKTKIPAHGSTVVRIDGRAGVPLGAAVSAWVNLTAVSPAKSGYLTAYAAGLSVPQTSSVNFARGVTRGQLALVNLNDGSLAVRNGSSAPLDVVVDIVAYTVAGDADSQVDVLRQLSAKRVYDSRRGGQKLGANTAVVVSRAALGMGPSDTGVIVTVTAASATRAGYLRFASKGTSVLNYAPDSDAANLGITPVLVTGGLTIHNGGADPVHVIVDVVSMVGPHTIVSGVAKNKLTGTPVAGLTIRSTPRDVVTGASGRYRTYPLPESAVCAGGPGSRWVESCFDLNANSFVIGNSARLDFSLVESGTIKARVVDPVGAEVASAHVIVEPTANPPPPGSLTNGRGGTFDITGGSVEITGLAPGDYYISFNGTAENYQTHGLAGEWLHDVPSLVEEWSWIRYDPQPAIAGGMIAFTVGSGATTDLGTVGMTAAGSLQVNIQHQGGVAVHTYPEGFLVRTVFQDSGSVTLPRLLPGEYTACAMSGQVCTPTASSPRATITTGQTTEVTVMDE